MWHRVGLEPAVDWGIADSREPTLWVHFESEVPFLCQFQEPSLYTIKAVFILDNDGRRLLAKVTPHHRNPEDGAGCHMSKTSGPHPARLTPLGETAFWMAEQPSLGSLEVTLSTLCLNSLTAGGEEGHPLCSYCAS